MGFNPNVAFDMIFSQMININFDVFTRKVVDENQFIKCLFIAWKGLKRIEIVVHKPYSF